MKPENHAIRQLEKQLEGAAPEVAAQIERVILSLKTVLMNEGDEHARRLTRMMLSEEVARLDVIRNPKKQT